MYVDLLDTVFVGEVAVETNVESEAEPPERDRVISDPTAATKDGGTAKWDQSGELR